MKFSFLVLISALVISVCSCKTTGYITLHQLTSSQKQAWDSLYENWISNGMGTCVPMMETQLTDGQCTEHILDVKIFIGQNGIIQTIEVLENKITCRDRLVKKSLEECMLETVKTDFVFPREMKGKILVTSVGKPE